MRPDWFYILSTDIACEAVTTWDRLKPENKRLTEMIGCARAGMAGRMHNAVLAAALACALAAWLQ